MQAIVQRVKDILLDPRGTWPRIAAEPATVASVFNPYVLVLAAIGPVAAFIGMSLIGFGGFGVSFRLPIGLGLTNLVVGYALALAMVYLLSLVVDWLAPSFGGQKNGVAALKLVAYGATAGMVGGIFSLFPMASILGLLAALYSVYLIYVGLPVLMRCPPERALPYTAVVVVCGFAAGLVLALASSLFTGSHRGMMMGGMPGGGGEVTINTPKGEVKIDTAKIEAATKRMQEAAKQMEEQAKAGGGAASDPAAAAQAAAAVLGAMAGNAQRPVMAAADIKALLPETLAGMKRSRFEASSGTAVGIATAHAEAEYRDGNRRIELEITDTGGLAGVMALAGWANMTTERESDGEVEKVYKQGNRTMREAYRKDGSHGETTVVLPNGIIVEAKGDGVPVDQLKAALATVDLARLEAVKAK